MKFTVQTSTVHTTLVVTQEWPFIVCMYAVKSTLSIVVNLKMHFLNNSLCAFAYQIGTTNRSLQSIDGSKWTDGEQEKARNINRCVYQQCCVSFIQNHIDDWFRCNRNFYASLSTFGNCMCCLQFMHVANVVVIATATALVVRESHECF